MMTLVIIVMMLMVIVIVLMMMTHVMAMMEKEHTDDYDDVGVMLDADVYDAGNADDGDDYD
eukprot:754015-Karenia_brevis.AAC.1